MDPECKDGLTPKELTDLLIAFYEVNDLSDFFRQRAPAEKSGRTEFWFQRWLAIGKSIGLSKSEMLNDYYFDELLAMFDEYGDINDPTRERVEEVYADEIEEE